MAESRWSERGFSLLELMVALAVFVVSIGVLLAAQTASMRSQERARNLFTATALMRELLTTAETEGIPGEGDENTDGEFGDKYPGFKWRREISDAYADASLIGQAATFGVDLGDVQASLPGLRQVKLTVEWGSEESPESTSITYYAVSGW